jgi:hypothetical protein
MVDKERILFMHHQDLVEDLFDGYACSFDDHLVNRLQYDVPNMMLRMVAVVLVWCLCSFDVRVRAEATRPGLGLLVCFFYGVFFIQQVLLLYLHMSCIENHCDAFQLICSCDI